MQQCNTFDFIRCQATHLRWNDSLWGVPLVWFELFQTLISSSNVNCPQERVEFLSTWKTKNWYIFPSHQEATSTISTKHHCIFEFTAKFCAISINFKKEQQHWKICCFCHVILHFFLSYRDVFGLMKEFVKNLLCHFVLFCCIQNSWNINTKTIPTARLDLDMIHTA